jgi:hypothetical protein
MSNQPHLGRGDRLLCFSGRCDYRRTCSGALKATPKGILRSTLLTSAERVPSDPGMEKLEGAVEGRGGLMRERGRVSTNSTGWRKLYGFVFINMSEEIAAHCWPAGALKMAGNG